MHLEILNIDVFKQSVSSPSNQLALNTATHKLINAEDDITAIKTWLVQFIDTKTTFANYRKEVERFLLWCSDQNKTFKQLKFEDIIAYRHFCQNPQPYEKWVSNKRYSRRNKLWRPFSSESGLSKNSLKLAETTLSGLFSWLCNAGYLSANPFKLQKAPVKTSHITHRYLEEDIWQVILHAINDNLKNAKTKKSVADAIKLKWIISLFYLTGLRISEAINNSLDNFKQEKNGNSNEASWWLYIVGKGNKMRKIPVNPELIEIMNLYKSLYLNIGIDENIENLSLVSKVKNKNNKRDITTITRASLHNWIKCIFEIAKEFILKNDEYEEFRKNLHILDKASAHWIRHTTWTHMANKNIDLRFIRDNAGHTSISTTSIYLHSEDKKRHEESIKHSLIYNNN
ncbi:MAG: hypothetical protein RLZZ210_675 [Pseudomonadota bacterium]|jgi:site-specific recombinase XerD